MADSSVYQRSSIVDNASCHIAVATASMAELDVGGALNDEVGA